MISLNSLLLGLVMFGVSTLHARSILPLPQTTLFGGGPEDPFSPSVTWKMRQEWARAGWKPEPVLSCGGCFIEPDIYLLEAGLLQLRANVSPNQWRLPASVEPAATILSAGFKDQRAGVRAVRGKAFIWKDQWQPLKVGTVIGRGVHLATGDNSTLDFFLGDNGPVARLGGNSILTIEQIDKLETGVEKVIHTRLFLKSGQLRGNVKKLAVDSLYEIRTPVCLMRVKGTEYAIQADGEAGLISGKALYKDLRGEVLLDAGAERRWRSSDSPNGICELHQERMEVTDVPVRVASEGWSPSLSAEAEKFPHPGWVWVKPKSIAPPTETRWICKSCVQAAKENGAGQRN